MYVVIIMGVFLVILVYFVFSMIFYKSFLEIEMMTSYECGFDPRTFTRMSFSYRFFLISILFLIFDVEISLILPIPYLVKSVTGNWIFVLFLLILIMGLLYEYYCGALDWLNNFVSKA